MVGNVRSMINIVQDGKKPWKTKCICDEATPNDRPLDQSFQGLQMGQQTLELSFDKSMERMGRNLMLRGTNFVTYCIGYGLQKTFGFTSLGLTARPFALSLRPCALQQTLLLEPKTPTNAPNAGSYQQLDWTDSGFNRFLPSNTSERILQLKG